MAAPDETPCSGRIVVRLATATGPRTVEQRDIELPAGACLRDAIATLGIDAASMGYAVGVWGRVRPLDWPLHEGDRIEFSRVLRLNPMEARRLRHQHQKTQKAQPAMKLQVSKPEAEE